MHLRKSLVAVAAVVAAGLIGLSGTAFASTGTVSGIFKSGNATFAGSTYTCTTGSVAGSYDTVNNPALVFSSLNITCNTPVGNANISLNSCTVPVSLTAGRTATLGDTNITGTAAFGTGTCVKVSALGGLCTANVQGTVTAKYTEATKVVGGVTYQDLILSGSGTLANQSGCLGLLTGSFTLNNIDFNIAGTPGPINFV